jgi:hypothetical protein
LSNVPRPYVARISEANPQMRRIHVVGEVHPGELVERGYVRQGEEWVLDLRRPQEPGREADPFVKEFEALSRMGYDFAEGAEWSPRELLGRFRSLRKPDGEKP